MLILLTGGSGNMGTRLATALLARGERVRILCMPHDRAIAELSRLGMEVVFGDLTDKNSLTPAVQGVDVVFHLAAVLLAPASVAKEAASERASSNENIFEQVNSLGTRNVVNACVDAQVNHLIYVSSISVMYSLLNPYARSKKQGEGWIRKSRLKNYTIVRPSLAYNEGGAEEFMRFVSYLKKSFWVFLPDGGKALKRPVHIDDLVTALLAIPSHSKSYGQTYLLTGSESISLKKMAQLLLMHMGKDKKIISIPIWLCHIIVWGCALRTKMSRTQNPFTFQTLTGLIQDADFHDEKSHLDLNFNPRTFRDGIETLTSLKNSLHA